MDRQRALVRRTRLLVAPADLRHPAGTLEQRRLGARVARQVGRLLEVPLRLLARSEGRGTLACPCESLVRLRLDRRSVGRVRRCAIGVDVMRREHLDDLVLGRPPLPLEVLRRGEMTGFALLLRERLVGDEAEQVLQEAVLATLGRARIALDREHLLAHERREQRLQLRLRKARQRRERLLRERLAEHGGVLERAPLARLEAVESRRHERVQRLRDLERLDRARQPVAIPLARDQAAVEEHAHRLDRVQRHAFRPLEDARRAGRPAGPERARPAACRSPHRRAARARSPCSCASRRPRSGGARRAPAARPTGRRSGGSATTRAGSR